MAHHLDQCNKVVQITNISVPAPIHRWTRARIKGRQARLQTRVESTKTSRFRLERNRANHYLPVPFLYARKETAYAVKTSTSSSHTTG